MAAALPSGFADPVLGSQAVFRAVMDALARPGAIRSVAAGLRPPPPLTPELAAVALTLADHEAPLWLDPPLAAEPAVTAFLRFHTGAAVVPDPADAAFALAANPAELPPFETFALGSEAYPDRSTTIVLALAELSDGPGLRLSGPGIRDSAGLRAVPLPADILERLEANRRLFPRGVDLVLTAPGRVAGLPRSTRVLGTA